MRGSHKAIDHLEDEDLQHRFEQFEERPPGAQAPLHHSASEARARRSSSLSLNDFVTEDMTNLQTFMGEAERNILGQRSSASGILGIQQSRHLLNRGVPHPGVSATLPAAGMASHNAVAETSFHGPSPLRRRFASDLSADRTSQLGSVSQSEWTNASDSSAATNASAFAAPNARIEAPSMDSDSLLHNSCKLYPETFGIVESALQLDPAAIRRRIPVVCNRMEDGDSSQRTSMRKQDTYHYPINIALTFGASLEIVKLLVKSGPDVLEKPDGPTKGGSLSIAIASNAGLDVIDELVEGNRACASVADRHTNYPLHILARKRDVTVPMIARVHEAFPEALTKCNKNGATPLDIAIRFAGCPEHVLDFLQRLSFGRREDETLLHLDEFGQIDDIM